jgi:hypothetical protein
LAARLVAGRMHAGVKGGRIIFIGGRRGAHSLALDASTRPLAVSRFGETRHACRPCLDLHNARALRARTFRSPKRCRLCRQPGHFAPTCPGRGR